MSGGSFDYVYYRIREAGDMTKDKEIRDLLYDLADLLHDEEWYESGDYRKNQYLESLARFKKKWFKEDRKERMKKYIDEEFKTLKESLYSMIGLEIEDAED